MPQQTKIKKELLRSKGQRESLLKFLEKEMGHANGLIEKSPTVPVVFDALFEEVESSLTQLTDFLDKYQSVSNAIFGLLDETEEDLEKEAKTSSEVELQVSSMISKLSAMKNRLSRKMKADSDSNVLNVEMKRLAIEQEQLQLTKDEIKRRKEKEEADKQVTSLPPIEVKVFCGDIRQWRDFWDSFQSAVDRNSKLTDVQKLNYLKSKLEGDAMSVVQGLPLTNENYAIAKRQLQERFGDQNAAINAHYQELIDFPPVQNNDVIKLRVLYDSVQRSLRCLQALGEQQAQSILIPIITKKMPKGTMIQLELQKDSATNWTMDLLMQRLGKHITARETAERVTQPNQGTESSSRWKGNQNTGKTGKAAPSTTQTLAVTERENAHRENQHQKKFPNNNMRTKRGCAFCGEEHWSDECKKYPDIESRKQKIKDSSLCWKCLRSDHFKGQCTFSRICVYCKKQGHHRSLCFTQFGSNKQAKKNQNAPRNSNTLSRHQAEKEPKEPAVNAQANTVDMCYLSKNEKGIFPAAVAQVFNPVSGKKDRVRIGFDSFSNRSYMSRSCAKTLELGKGTVEKLSVFTFGSKKPVQLDTVSTSVGFCLTDGSTLEVKLNIINYVLGGEIIRVPVDLSSCSVPFKIFQLADPLPPVEESAVVDVLLGVDYFFEFFQGERIILKKGLHLINTKLGWVFAGRVEQQNVAGNDTSFLVVAEEKVSVCPELCMVTCVNQQLPETKGFCKPDACFPVSPNLEDWWSLESIGVKDCPHESDDDRALALFNKSVKFEEGRYFVKFPWKEDTPELPDNYNLCLGRLKSLFKRLHSSANSEILKEIDNIIRKQEERGMVEKVSKECQDGNLVHYIPHHPVVTPLKTTTKVREAYDASAKTKVGQKSLNECLHRGPVMLEDLCGLLMRFHLCAIGIVADLEKAFLQVGLQIEDRDVTRFLWVKEISKPPEGENLQIFRFCRVPFGIISSPFLLASAVDYHLKLEGTDVAEKIRRNIYVDNVICGADSVLEAEKFYAESKQMFQKASMVLREWTTNSEEFKKKIDPDDQVQTSTVKVLGLIWQLDSDSLVISGADKLQSESCETKRQVLHALHAVFDPLGYCNPVTLGAKIFLQKLWKEKLQWDEKMSQEKILEWNSIVRELFKISSIVIPRRVGLFRDTSEKFQLDLVCFCDASAQAYASCVYVRISTNSGCSVDLMFSKCRLAPVKGVSLPRLELLGVMIGSKMLQFVEKQLQLPVKNRFIFSDSQCVLQWLLTKKKLERFVDNRVKKIKELCDTTFCFIPTHQNPADLATRSKSMSELSSALWWFGPVWLTKPLSEWPQWQLPEITPEVLQAVDTESSKSRVLFEASNVAGEGPSGEKLFGPSGEKLFGIDVKKFSTLTRLLRVTAWVSRFIFNLKHRNEKKNGPLGAGEIQQAKLLWEKNVQKRNFTDVLQALREKKKHALIKQLGLFLDENEIIRCKGRMEFAELPSESILPKLLPRKDAFTTLVVENLHKRLLHVGVPHTLAQLRLEYWLPKGRTEVKGILLRCQVCRRYEGGPFRAPEMPALPSSRVSKCSPFTYTGVDYLGPLYVKTGTDESTVSKVWICLFTCLTVRAIHLELISDLSAEQFLNGLRRFMAQKGKPAQMISDNAPQFKLAKTTVDKLWENVIRSSEVQSYISVEGMKWMFIPELAPWFGGMYERLVGLVKRALRKSVGRACLKFEQLRTVVVEVSAVVNSRPLVYVGAELDGRWVISPSDFLCLNPKTGIPEIDTNNAGDPDFQTGKLSTAEWLVEVCKRGQAELNSFWKMWCEDYLLSLRERKQVHLKAPRVLAKFEPSVGDVVLIKEQHMQRGSWKFGRIKELIKSSDGKFHSAKLILPNNKLLTRSITFLYPLECSLKNQVDEQNDSDNGSEMEVVPNGQQSQDQSVDKTAPQNQSRPQRKTAVTDRSKIVKWAQQLQ